TLKKEDRIRIPTDESFYEAMNKKIMIAIEHAEVTPKNKWEKPWVFLEPSIELNEGAGNLRSDKFKAKVTTK
ncbi:MAG: hypothetical protein H7235_02630, partial [Bdellovibrionaceae bacterium]|nr:hypothetical protein [Pseudobdellovibrionaceae bacterium]